MIVKSKDCCNGNCEQGRLCERHIERKRRNREKFVEAFKRVNWVWIGVFGFSFAFWAVVIWGLFL